MKKYRFAAVILLFAILAMLIPGASAATIVLTAVNDGFLPLSASTMPTRRSGEWYVPYSVFTEEFPIAAELQDDGDTLVLRDDNTILTFSLSQSYVSDQYMNSYEQPAYSINDTVYVPVKLVCSVYGLSFSLIAGDYQVLRICDGTEALSDYVFIAVATQDMSSIVNTYKGPPQLPPESTPQPEPEPEPQPEPEPVDTSPEPVPPEEPITPAAIRPEQIYLTFSGQPNQYSGDLLDTLSAYGRQATFFLPAGQAWDGEFVRRMAAEGHGVGFLVTLSTFDQPGLLSDANARLFALTGMTSRLISVAEGSSQLNAAQRDAAVAAGYRFWDATVIANDKTGTASQVAGLMLASFDGTTATTVLGMHHARSTNAALTLILRDLRVNRVSTAVATTADVPVNLSGDIR
jgi:hypothetical protein